MIAKSVTNTADEEEDVIQPDREVSTNDKNLSFFIHHSQLLLRDVSKF
jgi:hypothetical protein